MKPWKSKHEPKTLLISYHSTRPTAHPHLTTLYIESSYSRINPIKLVLTVFPSLSPWHIATVSVLLGSYIFISDIKELVYFGLKVFFKSILSIFFRQVEIVGRDNIPRYGPVLFSINHANQFMDAVMVVCGCQDNRKVSYLMAEASWRRPIVGHIAWALDVVPVKRAQDEAKAGSGVIRIVITKAKDDASSTTTAKDESETKGSIEITGTNTLFSQELVPGDKIRPANSAQGLKVVKVLSDTRVLVEAPSDMDAKLLADPVGFDILKYTPLNVVFARVLERLAAGGAVGIFPEGGSHDRTDLLPLKVGVALIAYSAYVEHGMSIPIVPVGLNYFRAHRWRGRAIVEYGKPLYIDPNNVDAYKAGGDARKQVCNDLLRNIESAMRSVIVSTTDYDTMQLIHTARRLYIKSSSTRLDSLEKQDLSRRFAEGYRRLLEMPEPPKEWKDLQERLKAYYL
jgi:glycerol-3-phosphate O-acyltransferase/dihydroxyacetone phosphate acyltransferase